MEQTAGSAIDKTSVATLPQPATGVSVLDDYLTAEDASRLYRDFTAVEVPSSLFYLPVDLLADRDRAAASLGEYIPQSVAESIVAHLIRLLEVVPQDISARCHGFEIWTSHSGHTRHNNSFLHIDNDEGLRKSTGTIRAPMLGTILHLGPDAGLVGGETLFANDQSFCDTYPPFEDHDWQALTGEPDRCQVVEQRAGRLIVFDGHLAHGRGPVVDHPAGRLRIAFLANLWDGPISDVPQGICPLSPQAFYDSGVR